MCCLSLDPCAPLVFCRQHCTIILLYAWIISTSNILPFIYREAQSGPTSPDWCMSAPGPKQPHHLIWSPCHQFIIRLTRACTGASLADLLACMVSLICCMFHPPTFYTFKAMYSKLNLPIWQVFASLTSRQYICIYIYILLFSLCANTPNILTWFLLNTQCLFVCASPMPGQPAVLAWWANLEFWMAALHDLDPNLTHIPIFYAQLGNYTHCRRARSSSECSLVSMQWSLATWGKNKALGTCSWWCICKLL